MRKKIAVLMLIIPILIILAVYTATASAGLNVAVPVRSIKILTPSENGVLNMDISSDEKLYLDVEVLPSLAKNKKYSVVIENLGRSECGLSVDDKTGLISATDEGKAKITVRSNDGGFTDSLIVIADSSSVYRFVPEIYDDKGNKIELGKGGGADYSVILDSNCARYGFSADIKPASLSHSDVKWTSSDERILDIDPSTGAAQALLPGTARITAEPDNSDIVITIDVTVASPAFPISGVLVNGKTSAEIVTGEDAESVKFLVRTRSGNKPIISGEGAGEASMTKVEGFDDAYEVTLKVSPYPNGEAAVYLNDGSGDYELKIFYRPYSFGVFTNYDQDGDGKIIQKSSVKTSYFIFESFDKEDVRIEWSADDPSVKLYPSADGRKCTVDASEPGELTLYAKAYSGAEQIFGAETEIKNVLYVSALVYDENSVDHGIGGVLTLGNRVYENGEYRVALPTLELRMLTPQGLALYEGTDDVTVTLSGDSAELAENGRALNITGDGSVTLCAEWKYAAYFKEDTKAELTVKTVNGGVNVSTYEQLAAVSEDGKVIVLRENIMLGKKSASVAELKAMVSSMPTTYDWKYYENIGKARPEVYYAIEFKNDVYGNGFEINAEYIANAHDRIGQPLIFKGPLDFVSMKGGTASVKAQDNVSFLIRQKGVTLDNVVLKSCSDSSLYVGGELDLSRLRYVGTTLEIAADTIVQNSRISNGRTVVRVFGGGVGANGSPIVDSAFEVNVAEEKITARIESSILSNAREFILKIGTNRAIRARDGDNGENIKVAELTDASGSPYALGENHLDDDYFVNNYLLTDVTLKNCVLYNSGVFSVGIDTHFSGEMLWRGVAIMPDGWRHIAATSFASALRLEGDVKIYDWKRLDKVDSSTLIETTSGLASGDNYLKLDISAMLDKVSGYDFGKNISTEIDGVIYVHGGIAFYGGGKNYSVLVADPDNGINSFIGEAFNNYNINLSILADGLDPIKDILNPLYLQGTLLPLAAGVEDFRFYIYGSNSETSYLSQLEALQNGSAFDWIVPVA